MEVRIRASDSKYYRFVGHKMPGGEADRTCVRIPAVRLQADVHTSIMGPWSTQGLDTLMEMKLLVLVSKWKDSWDRLAALGGTSICGATMSSQMFDELRERVSSGLIASHYSHASLWES